MTGDIRWRNIAARDVLYLIVANSGIGVAHLGDVT
jgi:hypothetical protein